MKENSFERDSIVREQEFSVRKKIDKTKRTIVKLTANPYDFEVELLKPHASPHHQMRVSRVCKYEKFHHIIVNLLDTMVVPYLFNIIGLAQSVRNFETMKENKQHRTIQFLL